METKRKFAQVTGAVAGDDHGAGECIAVPDGERVEYSVAVGPSAVKVQGADARSEVYIGRQLIIDRDQKIIGYELLYRHSAEATQADFTDDVAAGAKVLSNFLTQMGTEFLLGDNLAFINVSTSMLDRDLIDLLPPARVVLEIVGPIFSTALLERCRELSAKGFRIALDNVLPDSVNVPLIELADYAKIDIQRFKGADLKRAVESLCTYPLQLIAEKVETSSEFRNCKELAFHAFQGFHFAHPETLSVRAINPAQLRVVELLNLVRRNAEFADIEATLKRDVGLSVRLLRYINSIGFGLSVQVRSTHHALTVLGYRQLYRWLSLLLLSADGNAPNHALVRTALTRGRLTEILGQEGLSGHERDNLFIVGLFSLIDAILGVPMSKAIDTLGLPDSIQEALLHRSGIYGKYLELAEACENDDWSRLDALAQEAGLTAPRVNAAHSSALAWSLEIVL